MPAVTLTGTDPTRSAIAIRNAAQLVAQAIETDHVDTGPILNILTRLTADEFIDLTAALVLLTVTACTFAAHTPAARTSDPRFILDGARMAAHLAARNAARTTTPEPPAM